MGGQLDSPELPPAPSYCCTSSCNLNDTRLSLTTAVPRSQSLSGWATVGILPGRVSREDSRARRPRSGCRRRGVRRCAGDEVAPPTGDGHEMSQIGKIYYHGLGVPADYAEAWRWHNLATVRIAGRAPVVRMWSRKRWLE